MNGIQKQAEPTSHTSDYTSKLASSLNELRKQSELCDVIINVGGRAFPAHKAVLASSSNYFRGMFSHGFKESTESEIKIEGDPEIFEVLLEYAYTGKMKIIPEVAFEILEMACYMQFTDIYQYCSQFMELNKFDRPLDKINMEDCFKLYQLAKCHGDLKDIVEKSLRYMCQNIQDLKETKYFMEMASSSFLDDFLRRPDLSSEDEEKEVLEMVINWLKHDWDKRHPHALSLLQQIRLGHVSEESLTTLLDADILKIPDCQRLLEKTLKLQKSEESKVNRSLDYPDLFATRSTITAPIALSFGGLFDTQDSDLDEPWQDKCQLGYFDVDIKEWKLLKQFAAPQHLGSLVVANRTLYAVGGNEDDMTDIGHVTDPYGKQLLEYDAELNKWKSLPPMENDHEVDTFAMVTLTDYLYVIGGTNWSGNRMNRVERFHLKDRVWQMMNPLPMVANVHCRWISAIVFEGELIVYGLKDTHFGQNDEHIIITYNTTNDSWHTAMTEEVQPHSWYMKPMLFVHRDTIYRVLYKSPTDDPFKREFSLQKPVVNKLRLRFLRNSVSITVGEDVQQDLIPANDIGAFRIRNEVFVNIHGFVINVDGQISDEQTMDVKFDDWQKSKIKTFDYGDENSNITQFTFDLKKLGSC